MTINTGLTLRNKLFEDAQNEALSSIDEGSDESKESHIERLDSQITELTEQFLAYREQAKARENELLKELDLTKKKLVMKNNKITLSVIISGLCATALAVYAFFAKKCSCAR